MLATKRCFFKRMTGSLHNRLRSLTVPAVRNKKQQLEMNGCFNLVLMPSFTCFWCSRKYDSTMFQQLGSSGAQECSTS